MKNVQVNTDGLQFDNANGTHTNVNTSATADTYINLPASSGTLALVSDIGGGSETITDILAALNFTSDTTLADIPGVSISLDANQLYRVWICGQVDCQSATTLNHKMKFRVVSGGAGAYIYGLMGITGSNTATTSDTSYAARSFQSSELFDSFVAFTHDIAAGSTSWFTACLFVKYTNTTVLQLQGAQNSSSAQRSDFDGVSIIAEPVSLQS